MSNKKQEERERAEEEKNLPFWQKRWKDIAAAAALIVFSIFTHISIFYAIGFLIFFGATGAMAGKPSSYAFLAKVMKVIFVVAMINVAVNVILPRTAYRKAATVSAVDQIISGAMSTDEEIDARDIFKFEREKAEIKVNAEYKLLLSQGKVDEAIALRAEFEKKWKYRSKPQAKNDSNQSNQSSANQAEPDRLVNAPMVPPEVRRNTVRDSIFMPGTYFINVAGATPFYIKVPAINGKTHYTIIPTDGRYDYKLLFRGESAPIQAGPNVSLGDKTDVRFRLLGNKMIKLVVG